MKKLLIVILMLTATTVLAKGSNIALTNKKEFNAFKAEQNNQAEEIQSGLVNLKTDIEKMELAFDLKLAAAAQVNAKAFAGVDKSTTKQMQAARDLINTSTVNNDTAIFKDITKVLGGLCTLLILSMFRLVYKVMDNKKDAAVEKKAKEDAEAHIKNLEDSKKFYKNRCKELDDIQLELTKGGNNGGSDKV